MVFNAWTPHQSNSTEEPVSYTHLLSTGSAKQKVDLLDAAQMLVKHGYTLYATGGSSKFLTENGIENTRVRWPSEEAEGGAPKALEMLHNQEIDRVVNIPKNLTSSEDVYKRQEWHSVCAPIPAT